MPSRADDCSLRATDLTSEPGTGLSCTGLSAGAASRVACPQADRSKADASSRATLKPRERWDIRFASNEDVSELWRLVLLRTSRGWRRRGVRCRPPGSGPGRAAG